MTDRAWMSFFFVALVVGFAWAFTVTLPSGPFEGGPLDAMPAVTELLPTPAVIVVVQATAVPGQPRPPRGVIPVQGLR